LSSTRGGDDAFAAGATVDRYRVEGLLGEGGMGAVYAVVDPAIGRRFALEPGLVHSAVLCALAVAASNLSTIAAETAFVGGSTPR